jgi:hypothetical protein
MADDTNKPHVCNALAGLQKHRPVMTPAARLQAKHQGKRLHLLTSASVCEGQNCILAANLRSPHSLGWKPGMERENAAFHLAPQCPQQGLQTGTTRCRRAQRLASCCCRCCGLCGRNAVRAYSCLEYSRHQRLQRTSYRRTGYNVRDTCLTQVV